MFGGARCPAKTKRSSYGRKEEKSAEGWEHGSLLKPLPQVESAFGGEKCTVVYLFAEDIPVQGARETPGYWRMFAFSLIKHV